MQNQIPKNWQKVKLGELADLIPGFAFKSGDFTTDGTPVIKIRNIASGALTLDNLEYFAGEINGLDKYKINKGDILISMTGSHVSQWSSVVGKITRNNKDQVFLMNQRVGRIKPNPAKVDNDFLYYSLHNDEITLNLANRAGGSANQANISPEIINSLEIIIPELEEQKKIASIISAFDDKIEVNNKIAKTLEEMTQALFREWFVKFKFPGYEKVEFLDSELGKIPKGSEVKKIKDVAKINKGISYSSEEIKDNSVGLPMINLANFQRGGGFNPNGVKFYTGRYKTTDLVKPGDIVIAMTDLTSNREVIGHPARVPSYSHWDKMLISLDVCAVDTEELYIEFLYYLMLRKEFSYLMASSAGGTNVAHLSKSVIENYSFVLPERNLIKEFQDFIRPIFSQINKVELENQKLAALRDLLLPKLMKGEIRV